MLMLDMVRSTDLAQAVDDLYLNEIDAAIDEIARQLRRRYDGTHIDKSDGYLLTFQELARAIYFTMDFHAQMQVLTEREGNRLGPHRIAMRAGIHFDMMIHRENNPEDTAAGEKPLELVGAGKAETARVMGLALPGQTLMTPTAYNLVRRTLKHSSQETPLELRAYGKYQFQGVPEPMEVFEVGRPGEAPLKPPPGSAKAWPVSTAAEKEVLGWRPSPGQPVPRRTDWVLQEALGQGGFGEVWLARHKATAEPRVFKFCFDANQLATLKREQVILTHINEQLGNRPDIGRILDMDYRESPYYIESEWTNGGDLRTWAESRGGLSEIPLEYRLELVARVADALGAAHSAGVLHKDVKPSNVLVDVGEEKPPRIRLADFGISELVKDQAVRSKTVTMYEEYQTEAAQAASQSRKRASGSSSGIRGGTPIYMAPEAYEHGAYSIASDVYSLGILAYQMAIGSLDRPLGGNWRAKLEDDLLAEDIAACLHEDPEQRLHSARDLAERLRGLPQRHRDRNAERAHAEAARKEKEENERQRRLAEKRTAEAEAQRRDAERREREARRKTTAARRALAAALLVAVAIAGLTAYAIHNARRAQSQEAAARQAESAARVAAERAERNFYINGVRFAQAAINDGRFNTAHRTLISLLELDPGLRNWEWGFLMRQAHPELISLARGGDGPINDLDISADGLTIVSADLAGTARVYDLINAKNTVTIESGAPLRLARLNPMGGDLFLASTDGRARFASLADGRTSAPTSLRDRVSAAAYSPDGQRLVAATENGDVLVLEPSSGRLLEQADPLPGGARALALRFLPGGREFLVASDEGAVARYQLDPLELVRAVSVRFEASGPVLAATFSQDGALAAMAHREAGIAVAEAESGSVIAEQPRWSGAPIYEAVAFDPKAENLYFSSDDGLIFRLHIPDEVVEAFQQLHEGRFQIAHHPRLPMVLTASEDGTLKATDTRHLGFEPGTANTPCGNRDILPAFSADGTQWAVADGNVLRIHGAVAEPYPLYTAPEGAEISNFALNADWSQAAVALRTIPSAPDSGPGDWEVQLLLTNLPAAESTGQLLLPASRNGFISSITYSEDGTRLAASTFRRNPSGDRFLAFVWDLQTQALLRTMESHRAPVFSVAFLGTSRLLTSGLDGTVCVHDLDSEGDASCFEAHESTAYRVAAGPDGQTFATTGQDALVKLWDGTGASLRHALQGHATWAEGANFSPDGNRLVTASGDRTAKVWMTETGAELISIRHAHWVASGGFVPTTGDLWTLQGDDYSGAPQLLLRKAMPWSEDDLAEFGTDDYEEILATIQLRQLRIPLAEAALWP